MCHPPWEDTGQTLRLCPQCLQKVTKTIKQWIKEDVTDLQGCLESTDWSKLLSRPDHFNEQELKEIPNKEKHIFSGSEMETKEINKSHQDHQEGDCGPGEGDDVQQTTSFSCPPAQIRDAEKIYFQIN
ncbi:hypothetical protein D4764_01G0016840 [Takifugu flavidus]|uniref:Uncharacterized protein n=1 Tax=Takifugu flavidus TaxID=433684 RepID=A0A5C6PSK2_9TELE|nr:hypothetical protein D4764_01G0016840 [Takifugu flavidus]